MKNFNLRIVFFAAITILFANIALADGPFQFYSLTPCRIVDTRLPNGTNAGPKMTAGETRNVQVRGLCGVPTTAKAASLNVTIAQPTNAGDPTGRSFLTLWPSGTTMPGASTINFAAGDPPIANGAIMPLSTNTLDLSIRNQNGDVHVIIDVTGYYQ